MSFVSSLVGGILGSNAAGDAAKVGAQGARDAQALDLKNQNAALDSQKAALSSTTAAEQPYQALGSTSANSLASLLKGGFKAPTLAEAQQTPGYQFNLESGTRAINENAAANGTLMTGNTGTALEKFGQDLGTTTYQQDYNNAMNGYMANYQSLQGGVNSGLSSTGQLANANQSSASNTANIDMNGAQMQTQQINNAAAARASGYLGAAGAWSNAAGGMAKGVGDAYSAYMGADN